MSKNQTTIFFFFENEVLSVCNYERFYEFSKQERYKFYYPHRKYNVIGAVWFFFHFPFKNLQIASELHICI